MPWLTPDEIPEGTACRPLFIPDSSAWLAIVSGAIDTLTKEWNWEQFGTLTPEQCATRMQELMEQYYADACGGGEDVPAPFWDDPDGEDADDELPPETQPWYEELAHWFLAGWLAITFTPAAGIFYITTIRAARIAFRARNYGAVAEILIDGVLHGEVDTYSGVDQVIYYDFDIPEPLGFAATAFDPVEITVRHSGEHNPDATPTSDGYAIEVIRDYFGRDSGGAPISRVNEDGIFETSLDGGATYTENPTADPRNIILFPPLTGSDVQCRSANSIVTMIENTFDELLTGLANGGSAYSGAWLLVSLLAGRLGGSIGAVFFGAPIVAVAVFLISFIIDATIAVISSALTSTVYEKLVCIFRALLPASGQMLPSKMPLLYQALYDELDPTAAQVLDLFFDFVGPAGLSNFAAQDADPSGTCVCCTDRSENFTGGAHWFTTIGSNPYYPANETGGVYDATVGKTALGSAKGTLNNSAKRATVMIDLGKNCALDKQVFSYLMSPFQGGTPFSWRIWYMSEAGVLQGNIAATIGAPSAWTTTTRFDTQATVRYVIISITCPTTADCWLDDITIEVH